MRILLHDRSGHPFQVQLSRELASRGHEVLHSYGAFFQTPKGRLSVAPSDPATFRIEGINLSKPFEKYSLLKRRGQEIEYAKLLIRQIKEFSPECVVFSNVPPDALQQVYNVYRREDVKLVLWVQDFYSIAIASILKKRMGPLGIAAGYYYKWLEKRLFRVSDDLVLISDDFSKITNAWGIEKTKVHIMPNWAPLNEVPVRPKLNAWSAKHRLSEKFCILYSGTIGMKHNPELLMQLAVDFEGYPDVEIVVISEGLGADWLKQQKQTRHLENLRILDFQPFEQMPDVLGSADILVAVLDIDAAEFSVPSKILTYLCAERPLLVALPPENLAARIVTLHGTGLAVSPTDTKSWSDEAMRLYRSAGLRRQLGQNARAYAEKHFDIKMIGDKFEQTILTRLRPLVGN